MDLVLLLELLKHWVAGRILEADLVFLELLRIKFAGRIWEMALAVFSCEPSRLCFAGSIFVRRKLVVVS
jgi:hypothetical protein